MDFIRDLQSDDVKVVLSGLEKILQEETSVVLSSSEELPKALNQVIQKQPQISDQVCNVVAFLGREAGFRTQIASDGSLIRTIVPLLSNKQDSIQLQAMRAIGNLCHDEDSCRQQFMDCGGCPLLKDVLLEHVVSCDSVKMKVVWCGCLLNVCCNNGSLCKVMLDIDILTPLCCEIISKEKDESVLQMSLRALSAIVEEDCCTLEYLSQSPMLSTLTVVLQCCITNEGYGEDNDDIIESVLALLESCCVLEGDGSDGWKVAVVESGCFSSLLDLSSQFIPKAFDISVLLLSSDKALVVLFEDKKLWKCIHFHVTSSSVDVKLKASALLMIANMARNDANCEKLARDGTLDFIGKLMDYPVTEENSKLHYAATSLLRNLSLPDSNKMLLLQNGTIAKVVDVLNKTNDPTVTMKVLGCLRLLSTNKEVCKFLCIEDSSVDRVCEMCENASFDHIKIEGGRLIASLVKNSSELDGKMRIVDSQGVKWLLYLLKNEHMTIKNEGIVSLSLLASLKSDAFQKEITSADSNVAELLLSIMETCNTEVLENCLTLLVLLKDSSNVEGSSLHFTDQLKACLEKMKSHEKESIQTKVLQLL